MNLMWQLLNFLIVVAIVKFVKQLLNLLWQSVLQIRIFLYADPDSDPGYIDPDPGVKTKEEKLRHKKSTKSFKIT